MGGKRTYAWITLAMAISSFAISLTIIDSCGKSSNHDTGFVSRVGDAGIASDGISGDGSAPFGTPPVSNGNSGRTLSIEQAVAEVTAYEPEDTDAVMMDWHAFAMLKHELIRQLEEIATTRGVSSFPARIAPTTGRCTDGNSRNASSGGRDDFIDIPDVYVMPHLDGSNTVTWIETLNGDFDGDGEVNVADITPIANNYLKTYGEGYGDKVNDEEDRYLLYAKGTVYSEGTGDTDAASELGVPDITVIAQNYLMGPPTNGFAGYDVWRIPLAGGTAERIPNPTDADAPTVVRTGMYDAGAVFTVTDGSRTTSGIRKTSEIDENGDGWSNGDYYYWIEPRDSEDTTAPANPDNPKFNVNITYTTPFRLRAGQEVELKITVWGDATPISYGVNWGDGFTDSGGNASGEFIFAHTYSQDGTYVPIVAIQATTQGGTVMLMQEAPPVVIFPETPYAPTGLTVSPQGDGVSLNWDIVDPTPGDVFRIYYSLRRGDSRPILLGTTSDNTFYTSITDQLPGGKSVFFKVTCERGDFESSFSNESKYPESGIAAPVLTKLETSTDARVDLSWTSVADTANYTVTGYTVYKESALNDANPVVCCTPATLPATQTAYTYIPGTDEDSLYFFVRTVADGDRTSGRSNQVGWAKDVPEPPVNLEASSAYRSITVTWDASPSVNVTGYRVYYGTDIGKTDQSQGYAASKDSRMYTIGNSIDHPVLNGTLYYIWVAAEREGVTSDQTGPANATPFNTPPIAGFVASPSSGGAPLSVTFNALTGSPGSSDPDGAPLTYNWDYDDGSANGTGSNPTHEYTDEGEYTPILTVTDEEGATDDYTGSPITVATGAPVAVANASPKVGNPPLTVNFDANGSSDEDGEIVTYEWQYATGDVWHEIPDIPPTEDGKTTNKYTEVGTYMATLRVTDNDDKKAYNSVQIRVNAAPIAVAGANPSSGTKPLLVNFNANGSSDPDGTIVKWEWDWTNDGAYEYSSTSTGTATHTYTNSGDFVAKLRVMDNDGATDTDTVNIHVNAPPIADAQATPTSGYRPLTVNFNAGTSNDPDGTLTLYEWDFEGDGTYDWYSETNGNVSHDYLGSGGFGTFNARLRVTDDEGVATTKSVKITVYNTPPVADAVADPTSGNVPLTVNFTAGISNDPDGTIVLYEWDWENDGSYDWSNASSGTTSHTYEEVGCYTAKLRVTDSDDATSVDTVDISVNKCWHTETVDSVGDVGSENCIAVDSSDKPHISYLDTSNQDLKYAYFDGSAWNVSIADNGDRVGGFTSIDIDLQDRPHISYLDYTNGNNLKYAYFNGSLWITETVDDLDDPGVHTSIALDSSDRPHISCYEYKYKDLKYAYFNGVSWDISIIDSAGDVGKYTSIAIDSNDRPHISCFNADEATLEYVKWNGSAWNKEFVDDYGPTVGMWTGLALDTSDNAHICYYDQQNNHQKYAKWNGASWEIETVDDTGVCGEFADIALDANDYPYISYYFGSSQYDLKCAHWNGTSWDIAVVDSEGVVGYYTSIAVDNSDRPQMSYYDATNGNLKYAWFG